MNILFVRLSYIGDILHATAAARWIKQQYPDAKLHWIVTPSMAELRSEERRVGKECRSQGTGLH